MAREITIDLETYSPVDIKKSGVYNYVESQDFEILTMTMSVDDEPPITYDLASGDELPLERVLERVGKVDFSSFLKILAKIFEIN